MLDSIDRPVASAEVHKAGPAGRNLLLHTIVPLFIGGFAHAANPFSRASTIWHCDSLGMSVVWLGGGVVPERTTSVSCSVRFCYRVLALFWLYFGLEVTRRFKCGRSF